MGRADLVTPSARRDSSLRWKSGVLVVGLGFVDGAGPALGLVGMEKVLVRVEGETAGTGMEEEEKAGPAVRIEEVLEGGERVGFGDGSGPGIEEVLVGGEGEEGFGAGVCPVLCAMGVEEFLVRGEWGEEAGFGDSAGSTLGIEVARVEGVGMGIVELGLDAKVGTETEEEAACVGRMGMGQSSVVAEEAVQREEVLSGLVTELLPVPS